MSGDLPIGTARERAIAYLTLFAAGYGYVDDPNGEAEMRLGAYPDDPAWDLVDEAVRKVGRSECDQFLALEAAALLRDGWKPGDPVRRRGSR